MRLTIVNTLYAPHCFGGAERAVQALAEGLCARGHQVSVATLGEGDRAERSVVNGVTVRRIPLENGYWPYAGSAPAPHRRALWHLRDFHNAAMGSRLGQVLDEEKPDAVHTHNLAGFSVAAWDEAARRGLPIVHTLHDYYLLCPPSTMYQGTRNCARSCGRCLPFAAYRSRASRAVHAVTGVSRFLLDRHLGQGFFSRRVAASVVFNSVAPAARGEERGRAVRPWTFGFIGRVCEGKGVRWLLESFARCAGAGERLLIAGAGDPAFVDAMKARFASPAVRFLGQADSSVFFRQVDAVVVPSLWNEPFGRTVIEALAHRLPVIGTRRGGIPEILRDGVTGLLVDPDDAGSLAEAMRRLARDPARAASLGAAGALELPRYAQTTSVDAYERAYAKVSAFPEPVHA